MLEITGAFEDEKFVQEIAVILNEQLEKMLSANEGGSSVESGLGRFGRPSGGEPMIVPTMMKPFAAVAAEISDADLVSLAMESNQLKFKMKRPANLNPLITALVEDGISQSKLNNRQESLRKIAKALESYHSKNGFLPPAGWISDPKSKARLQFNWRVGLLPELGEQELYDQFDFSLPWDAPKNQKVAQEMPDVFGGLPSQEGGNVSTGMMTNLRVVGGKIGVYKGADAPVLEEVSDRAIWTSLVIECADGEAVQWTKPGALVVDEISPDRFGQLGENGVMFIDGRFDVRVVRKDSALISAVITSDGGEKMKSIDFIKLQ